MDIHGILKRLADKRPIYHNEADFQHSLAWELHLEYPDSKLRLEYPVGEPRKYIDIYLVEQGVRYFLELKYKTRRFNLTWNDEQYLLKNQGAQDLGRYDFIKDVVRLEGLKDSRSKGYAIFLTNDSSYYGQPQRNNTAYHEFRLTDRRRLNGILGWGPTATSGTTKGRKEPLEVEGIYSLNWRNFSHIGSGSNAKFDYLALAI
jgi:hypothetical protein